MARPATVYDFAVEGYGEFPLDMLRYDECWPQTTDDAFNIVGRDRRRVALRSYRKPTDGRWGSFGWVVVDTDQD